MNYITTDKYEKKIWILTLLYMLVVLVVGFLFQLIGDTTHVKYYPKWWDDALNALNIILLVLISVFGFIVIKRGNKIMRTEEYQRSLLKNNPEKKLTKEEEKKKYGL